MSHRYAAASLLRLVATVALVLCTALALVPGRVHAAPSTTPHTYAGLSFELPTGVDWVDEEGVFVGASGTMVVDMALEELDPGELGDMWGTVLALDAAGWEALVDDRRSDDIVFIGTETYDNDTVTVLASYGYSDEDVTMNTGHWLVQAGDRAWTVLFTFNDGGDFEAGIEMARSVAHSIELDGAVQNSGAISRSGGPSAPASTSEWLASLGDFSETSTSGFGDGVAILPRAGVPCLAEITHTGAGDFAVWGVDAFGDYTRAYVDVVGDFEGTVTTLLEYDEVETLAVEADGVWTVTFTPMTQTPCATSGSSFTGSCVAYIDAAGLDQLAFEHTGDGDFTVWAIGLDESHELLVDETGPYSGTVAWGDPQCVLIVTATGEWTVTW